MGFERFYSSSVGEREREKIASIISRHVCRVKLGQQFKEGVKVNVSHLPNSSSDSQASFRRQANDRRDHENALLVNYDGSVGSHQTKHGSSQFL